MLALENAMHRHYGISRLVFPFVAFVISLGPAWGQAPQTNNPEIGNLLDQYATIAGGWHLNQKCKFLGPDLAREFEWRVAMITVVVRSGLGGQISLMIQGAARRTVEEKYAGCDGTAEKIVLQTVTLARKVSPALGLKPYDPRTTYPAYMVARYRSVLIGLAVEDRCRHVSADVRPDMERVNDQVAEKLIEMAGSDAVRRVRGSAAEFARSRVTEACGARTNNIVSQAMGALRGLEKQFGLTEDPSAVPDPGAR